MGILALKFGRFNLGLRVSVVVCVSLIISILSIFINDGYVKVLGIESVVGFYSSDSLPSGMKSVGPLIENWWNWWVRQPPTYSESWPLCIMAHGGKAASDESVVFFANPANAVEKNINARNQNCEISSNQLIFFPAYNGLCDSGEFPGYTPSQLLECAIGTNKGIKIMNLKIDGLDMSDRIFHTNTSKPFIWDVPKVNLYELTEPHVGRHTAMAEGYYVFIKPLPIGTHTIELEVLRVPPEPNQPVEHPVVKYAVKVVPFR